jgi:hypothetical protein
MDIVADFLDRVHAERGEGGKKASTRAPFPAASAGGSASPSGGSRPPMGGGSVAPFPVPGTKPTSAN